MAKQKKPKDFGKKKSTDAAQNEATNGVSKNKLAGIKKKNKKNKKINNDTVAIKPNLESKKGKNPSPTKTIETVAQEAPISPPKKAIVDEVVANEILSNPKISKKKSKKKNAKAPVESSLPTNEEKKKKVKAVNIEVDEEEEITVQQDLPTKPEKKRKKPKKVSKESVVEETKEEEETETAVTPVKKKKQKLKEAKSVAVTGSEEEVSEIGVDNATKKDKPPMVSVFVGNLPINTKRGKILKLFSKFGKVKSIRFRLSNGVKFFKSQSKVTSPNVIAFVDFDNDEDAKASLVLNGEKIKDNVIRVNLQSNAKASDSFDGKRTVFVGNLKYSVTDQNLHDLFSCCGDIEYARTMQCEKGCNGIGYVCFKKTESVGMALELNNSEVQGRPVRVQRYANKTALGPKQKKNKKEKPTGAVRRLDKKQKVKKFSKEKGQNSKNQFTGMKAKEKNKKKKAFVKKIKKPLKGPKLLAKKIASREKPQSV